MSSHLVDPAVQLRCDDADARLAATLAAARDAAEQVAAWQARLVDAVSECMASEPIGDPWRPFLAFQLGLTPGEASQVVELADRLTEHPRVAALLATGERSLGTVLSIARRATPGTEDVLVDRTTALTAGQLQRVLREYQQVLAPADRRDPADEAADDEARSEPTSMRMSRRGGRRRAIIDFDDADAAAWQRAVDAERGRLLEIDAVAAADDHDRTSGAAVMSLVDRALGTRADDLGYAPEKINTHLVIHARETPDGLAVDRAALDGDAVPDWMISMLIEQGALTATVVVNGEPVLATAPRRFATAAQRRALLLRDGGCQYPGCGCRTGLIAHHITHWDHGGPTRLDNLVLLCKRHHRRVHRHSLQIRRDTTAPHGEHRWLVTRPDGAPLRAPTDGPTTPRRTPTGQRERGTHDRLTEYARDVLLHTLLTTAA